MDKGDIKVITLLRNLLRPFDSLTSISSASKTSVGSRKEIIRELEDMIAAYEVADFPTDRYNEVGVMVDEDSKYLKVCASAALKKLKGYHAASDSSLTYLIAEFLNPVLCHHGFIVSDVDLKSTSLQRQQLLTFDQLKNVVIKEVMKEIWREENLEQFSNLHKLKSNSELRWRRFEACESLKAIADAEKTRLKMLFKGCDVASVEKSVVPDLENVVPRRNLKRRRDHDISSGNQVESMDTAVNSEFLVFDNEFAGFFGEFESYDDFVHAPFHKFRNVNDIDEFCSNEEYWKEL